METTKTKKKKCQQKGFYNHMIIRNNNNNKKKGLWIYINVKTETFSQIILCIFMSKELLF